MPVPVDFAERLRVSAEELAEAEQRLHESASSFRESVVEARFAGWSLRAIGEAAGRSHNRIAQIVNEERERREAA